MSKSQRVPNTLVTLSAAAILAVYSAGFQRTRAAADGFRAQAARRRAALVIPATAAQTAVQPPPMVAAVAPPLPSPLAAPKKDRGKDRRGGPGTDSAKESTTESTKESTKDSGKDPVGNRTPAPPRTRRSTASAPSAPAPARQPELTASLAAPPAIAVAAPPAPAAPANSANPVNSSSPVNSSNPVNVAGPAAPPAYAPANPPAPSSATAAAAPKIYYEDGTYLGWGRSAHGNIQASVVIQNGRISSTAITKCETAYSCSWIAALPQQVVTRQNANIDLVSGASDSTYAFQDAVAAALFKAQRGG